MAWGALTECACGHVANHHTIKFGCHVGGCPCRRFKAAGKDTISVERHNAIVAEANRRIKKLIAERDELRAQLGGEAQ
jgi:hypothetical protein